MFIGIDRNICRIAWEVVLPAVERAAENEVTNKLAGCIVVLAPNARRGDEKQEIPVLWRAVINDWDQDEKYVTIAHAKASLTFKHGLPSSVIQQQFPYLYEEGDTKWGGSTIDSGGLIVAFSGVQAVFDEMIAEWMASAIRALCRHEMTREGGVMSEEYSYIGGT